MKCVAYFSSLLKVIINIKPNQSHCFLLSADDTPVPAPDVICYITADLDVICLAEELN